jgi:redox-sensitive bicupin YhaK (pirin superfamily)
MPSPGRAIEDRRHLDTVVDLVVGPRLRPLEGVTVNRVWPTPRRRLIGPFIFLDHLQRVDLSVGVGLDVPPHPHIGLATVTWLFAGELMHADSLGVRQPIRPGELNWMMAGRGITHSERSTGEDRARASELHGIQAWVAVPRESESLEPTFEHVGAADLPLIEQGGARLRLIAGSAYGLESPVATQSPLFYLDATLDAGSTLDLPAELGERGIYIVSGQISIDAFDYREGRLLVLDRDRACRIEALRPTRLMLLGGAPLDGDRAIWWNFVASDEATIETAKRDWAAGRFPRVPGDDDYMPLPG